jgi:hypothetical protein
MAIKVKKNHLERTYPDNGDANGIRNIELLLWIDAAYHSSLERLPTCIITVWFPATRTYFMNGMYNRGRS